MDLFSKEKPETKFPPITEEWKQILASEFGKPYIKDIFNFLDQQKKEGKTLYPSFENIFNSFNYTSPSNLKIVIIGQDPYHGHNQAHGLCFSVVKGVKPPPSLINIFKELKQDLNISIPTHGELTNWAKQGVLMLNAILTVEAHKAGSHQKIGWETFTNQVIKIISSQNNGIIFILWGRFAQSKAELIDPNKHFILQSAHPSPFSATRFFGCNHFSQTNEILKSIGKSPINWSID